LKPVGNQRDDLSQTLSILAVFVEDIGSFLKLVLANPNAALAVAPTASRGDTGRELGAVALTLGTTSKILRLASEREWVGLAFEISDNLHAQIGLELPEGLTNSVRVIRILLSMYQAASVEEAKAIFTNALEEEGSRETRYEAVSIDFGALL